MDKLEKIVSNMNYIDTIYYIKDVVLNQYVVTGMQAGDYSTNRRIGRIAQVRTEGSVYMSSATVLIRHLNGDLTSHSNQSYVALKGDDLDKVRNAFINADVYMDDSINISYSICGVESVKGFIVTPDDIERQRLIDERCEKITNLTGED